jgi:hypothetical protein
MNLNIPTDSYAILTYDVVIKRLRFKVKTANHCKGRICFRLLLEGKLWQLNSISINSISRGSANRVPPIESDTTTVTCSILGSDFGYMLFQSRLFYEDAYCLFCLTYEHAEPATCEEQQRKIRRHMDDSE